MGARTLVAALGLVWALTFSAPASSQATPGDWERTWGRDVVSGGTFFGPETCTSAPSCQFGRDSDLGGEGAAQGVAVNQATGDVYVVEFDNRVQRFDSDGTWERAWGMDAVAGNGVSGFEICTVAENCKRSSSGGKGGEMRSPLGVAVNQTTGDVYVADRQNRIQRFDSDGNFERAWGKNVDSATVATGFETCTTAASCKAGESGALGGELNDPQSIAVDSAGKVYVADQNNRVQRFDSDGNFERAWGKDVDSATVGTGFETCATAANCKAGESGALGGEMNGPQGLATDASTKVYLADRGNRRVQRFDSDGTFERAWGRNVDTGGVAGFETCTTAANCQAGESGALGGEMDAPRGIAVDASSNAYVSDESQNRIQRFDTDGGWERAWGVDADSTTLGDPGLEICTTAASCKASPYSDTGGGMGSPAGLAVNNGSGKVYLADAGPQRVQRFTSDGAFERAWGRNVDTGGNTDFEICTIASSCRGGLIGGAGEFQVPMGIARGPAGNLYVTDSQYNRIQRFDTNGVFQRAWGNSGAGFQICAVAANCAAPAPGGAAGQMSFADGIATDAAGNVYVADSGNHRVQKFDSDGTFVRAWGKDVDAAGGAGFEICVPPATCQAGTSGSAGGEMSSPTGIATDAAGKVYVVEQPNHRVQRFDSNGGFERAWGRNVDSTTVGTGFETCTTAANCQAGATGGLAGEMNFPTHVATDLAGKVYVADGANHRIQRFDSNGGFERTWGRNVDTAGVAGFETCSAAASCKAGETGGLGGEMNGPQGLATDAAGNLYVADRNNQRIQNFDTEGNWKRAWGKGVAGGAGFEACTTASSCVAGVTGGLGGEMTGPHGVATDAAGNVYVVDMSNNRVQRFAGAPQPAGGDGGSGSPGAGGGSPGGGGDAGFVSPPARDTRPPVIVGTPSARPREFEVDRGGRAERPVSAARKGTIFRYSLSEAATVTFTIERQLPGRRVRGRCRRETSSNRGARPCKRYRRVGAFRHGGRRGGNNKPFSGRIGRTTLRPGPHRAVLVAVDPALNRSQKKIAGFRVLKGR